MRWPATCSACSVRTAPGSPPPSRVVELPGFGGQSYLDYLAGGARGRLDGMTLRQRESIIGLSIFLLLPLTFLSTAFMAKSLMPRWMRAITSGNPVNWALDIGRGLLTSDPDRLRRLHMAVLCSGWRG